VDTACAAEVAEEDAAAADDDDAAVLEEPAFVALLMMFVFQEENKYVSAQTTFETDNTFPPRLGNVVVDLPIRALLVTLAHSATRCRER
jgi:hypothetical protein